MATASDQCLLLHGLGPIPAKLQTLGHAGLLASEATILVLRETGVATVAAPATAEGNGLTTARMTTTAAIHR